MARYKLLLPKMGESVAEATIIKWNKNIGDKVDMDEAILDIATDKVDSEVPSPVAGTLVLKLCNIDEVVQVGAVIAIIETSDPEELKEELKPSIPEPKIPEPQKPVETPKATEPSVVALAPIQMPPTVVPGIMEDEDEHEEEILTDAVAETVPGIEQLQKPAVPPVAQHESTRFYSPLVKNIAQHEKVTPQEMDDIPGSGADGRLTKDDLLAYIQKRAEAPAAAPEPGLVVETPKPAPVAEPAPVATPTAEQAKPAPTQPAAPKAPEAEPAKPQPVPQPQRVTSASGESEIIEMDRMRKLIAEHMVMSVQTSPHVTSFIEVDVTNIVLWREKNKTSFEKREGTKITYTPIFIEAVAKTIREMPMINVSVKGTQIIKKKDINIGMATALPSGNLIVPVIRRADELNVVGLTKAVNDLANRARNNKLLPDDVKEGTFTITNVGTFGNVMGTPIINQPQVAILAVGAIKKKPAVIETEAGDVIAVRHMMFLSLSYDHRVVDGALGGSFIRKVADHLEAWDINREL